MITPADRAALRILYSMLTTYNKQRYPNNPYPLAPKPFNLNKTNDLERAICKWFELYGYKAERIKVQGRRLGSDKVTYNVITGKRQTLDTAKWAPSTGAKGSADISVTCRDKSGAVMSLRVEVKNGYTNDRMRPDQLKYKAEHEASGGTYLVVRYFSEFVEWFEENVKKLKYY